MNSGDKPLRPGFPKIIIPTSDSVSSLTQNLGPRILLIEDEPALVNSLTYALEVEGYQVASATTGPEGIEKFHDFCPDLVLLDLMLPGGSGLDVCQRIRSQADQPIIMVTARDAEADKVSGLEVGADDYVTKPFSTRELVARIRAQLRRSHRSGTFAGNKEVLRGGPVQMDVDAHEVRCQEQLVALSPKEFDLLETLMRRSGRVCSREMLLDEVWGLNFFGDTKTLDIHIKRLRSKLEPDPKNPRHIVTVRGFGYKFVGS